ncbi:hypothetical protein FKF78_07285 [Aeromonas hydrophila]|nr:hypothetical protein [Aeromonas hydrophila]
MTYGFSGNTLTAMAGAATIFTLVVQSNGSYTFTLLGPLDHPNANGDDNELLTLNLTGAIRASDGVNSLPLAGDLLIQVEDDVPTIQASTNLVYSNSSNPAVAQVFSITVLVQIAAAQGRSRHLTRISIPSA